MWADTRLAFERLQGRLNRRRGDAAGRGSPASTYENATDSAASSTSTNMPPDLHGRGFRQRQGHPRGGLVLHVLPSVAIAKERVLGRVSSQVRARAPMA